MGEIKNIKIDVPKEKVLRRLGHKLGAKLDKRIESLIDKEIEEAYSLIDSFAVYEDLDIEFVKEDEVKLKNVFLIKSKNLAKILTNAKKATLIAVTIGDELEKTIGDSTIDVIRDAIGSEAVEALAIKVIWVNLYLCSEFVRRSILANRLLLD